MIFGARLEAAGLRVRGVISGLVSGEGDGTDVTGAVRMWKHPATPPPARRSERERPSAPVLTVPARQSGGVRDWPTCRPLTYPWFVPHSFRMQRCLWTGSFM